jgi:serine/threonine protein kinase
LGSGSFGVVKVFFDKRTQEKVAVKFVKKGFKHSDEDLHSMSEYFLISKLSHPYVIAVKELFENESHFIIVMNYIEGTNMAQFLFKSARIENEMKGLMLRICQGLYYLHCSGIAHRDIKLENILIIKR